MKRQPSEQEKLFVNKATDKGIIPKCIKSSDSSVTIKKKKKKHPIKKWMEDLNRHFSKEDVQMANKHMKRCSTSLIIKA